jgi:hypothetical protein
MQKEILLEIVKQNQFTSHFSFDRANEENTSLRLNDKTASIGFIFRHIGETMHLFGQFFGIPTDVVNTTMGQTDNGQVFDVADSRELISRGYEMLRGLVETARMKTGSNRSILPFLVRLRESDCLPMSSFITRITQGRSP